MPAKRTVTILLTLSVLSASALLNGQIQPSAAPLRVKPGTKIMVELESPLSTVTAHGGDTIRLQTRSVIYAGKDEAIPSRTRVEGEIVSARPVTVNGKDGRGEVRIRLTRILLKDGSSLDLQADEITIKGERPGASTAANAGNAALNVGTALAGLQAFGAARLMGGSSNVQQIMAGAAMGGSILSRALQPRGPGSEVDLPEGAILTTTITRALHIADPSRLAKGPPPTPADSQPERTAPPLSITTSAVAAVTADAADRSNAPARILPSIQTSDVSVTDAAENPALDTSTPPSNANSTVQPAGAFSMKVDVSLVQIDAVARSRNGKPMVALRAEDFRVFDEGQERQIQRFSRDQLPLAVALVIDRSGSVAPQMPRIQSAALVALQELKKDDTVCLVGFAAAPELLEPLTTDRQRVANRIGAIRAGGGTAIVDAVHETLLYLARVAPDRRHAIILISDNQEGASRLGSSDAVRLALETGAVIYSVHIESPMQPTTLLPPIFPGVPRVSVPNPAPFGRGGGPVVDVMTRETGGEIFDASGGGNIHGALETAITRLKTRYTLGYAPGAPSNSAYHRVEIRLTDRHGKAGADYTILSRTGYFDARRP